MNQLQVLNCSDVFGRFDPKGLDRVDFNKAVVFSRDFCISADDIYQLFYISID